MWWSRTWVLVVVVVVRNVRRVWVGCHVKAGCGEVIEVITWDGEVETEEKMGERVFNGLATRYESFDGLEMPCAADA